MYINTLVSRFCARSTACLTAVNALKPHAMLHVVREVYPLSLPADAFWHLHNFVS